MCPSFAACMIVVASHGQSRARTHCRRSRRSNSWGELIPRTAQILPQELYHLERGVLRRISQTPLAQLASVSQAPRHALDIISHARPTYDSLRVKPHIPLFPQKLLHFHAAVLCGAREGEFTPLGTFRSQPFDHLNIAASHGVIHNRFLVPRTPLLPHVFQRLQVAAHRNPLKSLRAPLATVLSRCPQHLHAVAVQVAFESKS
jgi:hypothetical protein